MTIYVGVDPGLSGSIAVVDAAGAVLVVERFYGKRPGWVVADALKPYEAHSMAIFVERVSASPQMGVTSAFNFGKAYGEVCGILEAYSYPGVKWRLCEPKEWQRGMGVVYPKGEKRDKNITKNRAEKYFPGVKVTHATADALLIAAFCRRCHEG